MKIRIMFVATLFMFYMLGATAIIYAQEVSSPTPDTIVTATPQPETPTAEPTAEPTPVPEPTPDPGISNNVLFLVVVVIVGLVATLLLNQKTTRDLAVQLGASAPEWAWQGTKATGMAGLDALQKKAKETIDEYDDEEVARLRKIAVDLITEIDTKRAVVAQSARAAKS